MTVITDASSAILLEKAGLFTTTAQRFSLVLPVSVFSEVTWQGRPGAAFFKKSYKNGLFAVQSTDHETEIHKTLLELRLGKGETDTLALYLGPFYGQRKDRFILIDDGKAARWCYRENLPFINALLVPKILWYAGHIKEEACAGHMEALCRIGRYSEKIKAYAFNCSQKELAYFIPEKNENESAFV